MRQRTSGGAATRIAGRILVAWKTGQDRSLREEFDHVTNLNVQGLNALEMERMELLGGIVQTLRADGARHQQHRAAIRLLEHLATETPCN
jgi:hypothetical protein